MLGKKDYNEKMYLSFSLSKKVPKDNFYRRLKGVLDLQFTRDMARPYYGKEGQKSIDPTVFFHLMLIGYLENIVSDRQLMEHVGMRMDLLYFAVRVIMLCLKKSSIRKTIRKSITELPAVTARVVLWLPVVLVNPTRNISG